MTVSGASDADQEMFAAKFPYPGLRSFAAYETEIFFGREGHVAEMATLLGRHRFLAVTGSSGSGKSSLVRTGLTDALLRGSLVEAGSSWRIADFRPGQTPTRALAEALLVAYRRERSEFDADLLAAFLRRGPLGLIEWQRTLPPPPRPTNLLLLVDQFEELFRFGADGPATRDEADGFVRLLLASAAEPGQAIYVVLTMRSDFLGECAEFPGLAEAISRSQFLTPRLTRAQLREAITGPARVFGGEVEEALVGRLLNDMGTNPDQLPLMQHAMMRLWQQESQGGAPCLRLETYLANGGINGIGDRQGALSGHADQVWQALDQPGQQALAERVFRALVKSEGAGGRDVRRPCRLDEIAESAGVAWSELVPVIDAFRAPGVNLLTPAWPRPLGSETVIDISHESLIRQWRRLRTWVEAEQSSAETYRRYANLARAHAAKKGGLLESAGLKTARQWQANERPTSGWAARYGGDFDLTMAYLRDSRTAKLRRTLSFGAIAVVILALVVVVGVDRLRAREMEARAAAAQQEQADRRNYEARLLQARLGNSVRDANRLLGERNIETARLVALQALAEPAVPASPTEIFAQGFSPVDSEARATGLRVLAPVMGAVLQSQDKTIALAASADSVGDGQPVQLGGDKVRLVAAGAGSSVRVWRADNGAALARFGGLRDDVVTLALSQDATLLAAGTASGELRVWRIADHTELLRLMPSGRAITALAFAPENDVLYLGQSGQTLPWRWRLSEPAPQQWAQTCQSSLASRVQLAAIRPVKTPQESVTHLAAGRDGAMAALTSSGLVLRWGTATGCLSQTRLKDWGADLVARAFLVDWSNMTSVIAASRSPGDSASVFAGSLESATMSAIGEPALPGLDAAAVANITWLASSATQGRYLVGTRTDVLVITPTKGQMPAGAALQGRAPEAPVYTFAGRFSVGDRGKVLAGDAVTEVLTTEDHALGLMVRPLPAELVKAEAYDPAPLSGLSPDGTLLAIRDAASGKRIEIRSAQGGALKQALPTDDKVFSFLFVGDGRLIAELESAPGRRAPFLLFRKDDSGLFQPGGPMVCDLALCQDPNTHLADADGSTVLLRNDHAAALLDLAAGGIRFIADHPDTTLRDAALLPDGDVAIVSDDGFLRRWRGADGVMMPSQPTIGHPTTVSAASDAPVAVTEGSDDDIAIHDVPHMAATRFGTTIFNSWSGPSGRRPVRIRSPGLSDTSISPDGLRLATLSRPGQIVSVWRTADGALLGFGTLPAGARLGSLPSGDGPPLGVMTQGSQIGLIPVKDFTALTPAEQEIFLRLSALRDMTPEERGSYTNDDVTTPVRPDPMERPGACDVRVKRPGAKLCEDRLREAPNDAAAWRASAVPTADGVETAASLPAPATLIAASLGHADSLRDLALWLGHESTPAAQEAAGWLLRLAAQQAPERTDDFVRWLIDTPDAARRLLASRMPDLAKENASLGRFAAGLLAEAGDQEESLATAFAAFRDAARFAGPGSLLRRVALQRQGSLARLLGPRRSLDLEGDLTRLFVPSVSLSARLSSSDGSARPPLPWVPLTLTEADVSADRFDTAARAVAAMVAAPGAPPGLARLAQRLQLAIDLRHLGTDPEPARRSLAAALGPAQAAFAEAPWDVARYQVLEALYVYLEGLSPNPCVEAVFPKADMQAKHQASLRVRNNAAWAAMANLDLERCAADPALSAEERAHAALAMLAIVQPPDAEALTVADALWSQGLRQNAMFLLARHLVAAEAGVRAPATAAAVDNLVKAQQAVLRRLPEMPSVMAADAAFAGLSFDFQTAGEFLKQAGKIAEATKLYDDAIAIRKWLAPQLRPSTVRDNVPVWGQIAYAYNWRPYNAQTVPGAEASISTELNELAAAEKQPKPQQSGSGGDLYVVRRQAFALTNLGARLLNFRSLTNASPPAAALAAIAERLGAIDHMLDDPNPLTARWAAEAQINVVAVLGSLIDPSGMVDTSADGALCDGFAADLIDPDRPAGYGNRNIVFLDQAIAACRAASDQEGPNTPRMIYELARANFIRLSNDGATGLDWVPAIRLAQTAARRGHDLALAMIVDASPFNDTPPNVAPIARAYARRMLLRHGRAIAEALRDPVHGPGLPAAADAVLAQATARGSEEPDVDGAVEQVIEGLRSGSQ